MKFEIKFANKTDKQTRTVAVELTADETARARAHLCPDVAIEAYALRHAYKRVPRGFLHICGRIKPIVTQ
jgi:hypothetical protein